MESNVFRITLASFCFLAAPLIASAAEPFQVFVVEDHSEALAIWAEAGVRGLPVLHVDAHDDLWPPPNSVQVQQAKKLLAGHDFLGLRKTGLYNTPRDQALFSINNFLTMSHELGIVDSVYWVIPTLGEFGKERLAAVLDELRKNDGRRIASPTKDLTIRGQEITGVFSGVPLTIGALHSFQPNGNPYLLDIDLDFFPVLYDNPVKSSFVSLLGGFAAAVEKISPKPAITVIAYSHDGGHLPIRLRFLGPWLRRLLSEPNLLKGPPPETWLLKEDALNLDFFIQYDDAASKYRRILDLEPDNADAYYSLGVNKAKSNHCSESLPYLKRAFSIDKAYLFGFLETASMCEDSGARREADALLSTAAELAPSAPSVADAQGNLAFNRGLYDEAATAYRRVVSLGSASPLTYAYLADALRLSGNKKEAVEAYRKAISSYLAVQDAFLPQFYWKTLGELLEELGKPLEAAKCYRQFQDVFPSAQSELATDIRDRLGNIEKKP